MHTQTFCQEKTFKRKLFSRIMLLMRGDIFWKMVKKEIDAQKTSFEWLYQKTDIPKGTFASWKSRKIIPRADEAFCIASALNVTVEYLLTGLDKAIPSSNKIIQSIVETVISFDAVDLETTQTILLAMAKRYNRS
jgi:hypothetical protein